MSELVEKDQFLHQRIRSISKELDELAMENIAEAAKTGGYSGPELYAMKLFEKLKLTADLELIPLMIRGETMKEIEENNLWTELPGRYSTVEQAYEAEGHMSKSEQSNVKDLYLYIFPYVTSVLGMSITDFWNAFRCKSNIREAIPYLKAAITGAKSISPNVNSAIERFAEEVAPYLPEPEKQKAVVEHIIDLGGSENNPGYRDILRPKEKIDAVILQGDGTAFLVAELYNADLLQKLHNYTSLFTIDYVSLRDYPPQRVPVVKKLLGGNQ